MVRRPAGSRVAKWDVGQRGTPRQRACTVKSILTGAHADPTFVPGPAPRTPPRSSTRAGDSNGSGYDPWSRPGVGRPSQLSRRSMPTRCSAPWATTTRPTNRNTAPMSPRRSRQRSPTGSGPRPVFRELSSERRRVQPRRRRNRNLPNTRSPPPIPTPRSSRPNPSCTTCWRQPALKNQTATFIAANETASDPTPGRYGGRARHMIMRSRRCWLTRETYRGDRRTAGGRPAGRSANHRVDRDLPSGTDRDQFCAADRPDRRGRSLGLTMLTVVCLLVVTVLAICYRPLLFATVDRRSRPPAAMPVRPQNCVRHTDGRGSRPGGCPDRRALLVMSLLITPAAAAAGVVVAPVAAIATSVVFAEVSAVGGITAVAGAWVPVLSVFVATISFVIYTSCPVCSGGAVTSQVAFGHFEL